MLNTHVIIEARYQRLCGILSGMVFSELLNFNIGFPATIRLVPLLVKYFSLDQRILMLSLF